MREIDLVLDLAVNLGDRMLDSGANLERVNTSIHRILHTYGFQERCSFYICSGYSLWNHRTVPGLYSGLHRIFLYQKVPFRSGKYEIQTV